MPDLIIYLFSQSNQYYWHVTKEKGKYKEISYEIKGKWRIMSALPSLISPRIPNFFSSPHCLFFLQINRKLGFLGGYSIKIRTNTQKYKAQKMKSKSAQVLFLKTKKRYLVLCSTYVFFFGEGRHTWQCSGDTPTVLWIEAIVTAAAACKANLSLLLYLSSLHLLLFKSGVFFWGRCRGII